MIKNSVKNEGKRGGEGTRGRGGEKRAEIIKLKRRRRNVGPRDWETEKDWDDDEEDKGLGD
ncbi:MAG: hypothetical protein NTZ69_08805 [Bacteroidia bacterium]|nr:hypothetical protein [Bacteroidia bacterium]